MSTRRAPCLVVAYDNPGDDGDDNYDDDNDDDDDDPPSGGGVEEINAIFPSPATFGRS